MFKMNFNQDFTSISVLGTNGFRLFSLQGIDKIEEIFSKDNESDIKIVERLFNSSLVVIVTKSKANSLKMLHFKKKQDICNCVYPSDILTIRMNRTRLVVCLLESVHIHDIRDMKILHSIENLPANHLGLCSLSLNSQLAYPTGHGELKIFNTSNLKEGLTIKAHETSLSAITLSSNGILLATASELGTVIRVFCVKNGQKVCEFRRGTRCVQIESLVFSSNADYVCASSNKETIHIFRVDQKLVEETERRRILVEAKKEIQSSLEDLSQNPEESWSGYLTKAVTTYFPDVFNQDRAFSMAQLQQAGLKHICALVKIQKQLKLLVGCEDGFLYIYDFNENGGNCKLLCVHDLRNPLEDVIELNLNENNSNALNISSQTVTTESPKINPKFLDRNEISYAGILKGASNPNPDKMTAESEKYRKLCDAIETPDKILLDDLQFPPVEAVVKN